MNIEKNCFDCNKTFKNESNFGIKELIRVWYAVKQISQNNGLEGKVHNSAGSLFFLFFHIFNFTFLNNSQWTTFPTHSCLVLYSIHASLLHSLIKWLLNVLVKTLNYTWWWGSISEALQCTPSLLLFSGSFWLKVVVPVKAPSKGKIDIFKKSWVQGAYNKFPDFVRMGTFIESTHMKL